MYKAASAAFLLSTKTNQMFNPSEFRLGNLVYRIDRSNKVHLPIQIPLKIVGIGLFTSEVISLGVKIEGIITTHETPNRNLTPIPLSENLLLRFGMKQLGMNKFEHYDTGVVLECSYELKYAHRLQNLYFETTDQELKLY